MISPRLAELPPPPAGKTGWPWNIESTRLPDAQHDGSPWPVMSIVTPSYNQGEFIEETIRSVLLQGYPNLQYIVMDGGSTDQSVAIIKKYSPWLSHWVSEKDGGQSAAINKGFSNCSGEIRAWINSDDGYLPNAFQYVVEGFGIAGTNIVVGNSLYKKRDTAFYVQTSPIRRLYLDRPGLVPQHATFWRSSIHEPIDERFQCAMDTELWLRLFAKAGCWTQIPYAVAYVNLHADQKTTSAAWDWARPNDQLLLETIHHVRWWQRGASKPIISRLLAIDREMRKLWSPSADFKEVSAAISGPMIIDESASRIFRST